MVTKEAEQEPGRSPQVIFRRSKETGDIGPAAHPKPARPMSLPPGEHQNTRTGKFRDFPADYFRVILPLP